MKISKSSVWVFDLDDTLYLEREYQLSGYQYIAQHLEELYKRDVWSVVKAAEAEGKDVFQEICYALSLPETVKESLLWLYRVHKPSIRLTSEVKCTLEMIKSRSSAVAIITDGRSISQRNKLLSLELDDWNALVSEEWGASKPDGRRFQEIERRYPDEDRYIYVGDNIKKDFIMPNRMNWLTIGIKDSGNNIHPQNIAQCEVEYLPHLWVNSISELQEYLC